jgi:hypothetical protein
MVENGGLGSGKLGVFPQFPALQTGASDALVVRHGVHLQQRYTLCEHVGHKYIMDTWRRSTLCGDTWMIYSPERPQLRLRGALVAGRGREVD